MLRDDINLAADGGESAGGHNIGLRVGSQLQ